jgi:hypothetical protein
MTIKEFIQKFNSGGKIIKERIKQIDIEDRAENIVQSRKLSANERELNRYIKEEREKSIKQELDIVRKERQREINFDHNALNAKNIIAGGDNLLKAKKIFTNHKNMFIGQESCLKGNPDLLKNNERLMR